ncbi:MAG: hypothetical protein IBJ15_17000 [Alphaproteobacteria bacterium]|nr:hypothetical protein [Alphaproteobacteria bacterium]
MAPIGEREAKAFVVAHHYSASYPAARLAVGLFEGRKLAGVAVFSVPMRDAVLTRWTGLDRTRACELGRFVLLDRIPGNAETWFLARAMGCVRREKSIDAIVAFSDPMIRRDTTGRVVMPGHVGGIYASASAFYAGRSRARKLWLDADGRVVSERALSKLARDERGAERVYARLRAAGAPARVPFESGDAYIARALTSGPFERRAHPGNHAYLLACGAPSVRRRLRESWAAAHGYRAAPRLDQAMEIGFR